MCSLRSRTYQNSGLYASNSFQCASNPRPSPGCAPLFDCLPVLPQKQEAAPRNPQTDDQYHDPRVDHHSLVRRGVTVNTLVLLEQPEERSEREEKGVCDRARCAVALRNFATMFTHVTRDD